MNPVQIIEARGVPLDRSDVDTDQIIPSEWLKRVERTGFGRGLFSEWRDDPSFVLNQADYQGAEILIGGARFGIGSSREHAVWALMDYGFRAVVASSFGDIFKNNSSKQGLVTVEIDDDDLQELLALVRAHPHTLITIDVASSTIEVAEAGWQRTFAMSPMTRERLLNGWDDIGLTMRHEDEISTFEARRDVERPSLRGLFDDQGRALQSSH